MENLKPVKNSKAVIETFDNVLNKEINKDDNYVSIAHLYKALEIIGEEYNNTVKTYEEKLSTIIRKTYSDDIIEEIRYYYDGCFGLFYIDVYVQGRNYESIMLKKKDDDLYVCDDSYSPDHKCSKSGELLVNMGHDLSLYMDELYRLRLFKITEDFIYKIPSDFNIKVHFNRVASHFRLNDVSGFNLCYEYYKKEYWYDCNSYLILQFLYGHENELINKIFFKIEDCPEWMIDYLYQIRKEELQGNTILNDNQKNLDVKRIYRLWLL